MTDTPTPDPETQPDSTLSNVSGGVAIDGQQVTIGGDVIGRDKVVQAGTYIEHATIIQAPQSPTSEEPLDVNARTWGGIEFIRIPAGSFVMGSASDNALASDAEKPQHAVEIAYDYWIARYPVTNEQFARFIDAAHRPIALDKNWSSKADHPVVNVNWREALEYCNWLQSSIGKELLAKIGRVRLPTEAEWEKAARGDTTGARESVREWPWGNDFDQRNCNSEEGSKKTTTSVGLYSPDGDSPCGLADMAGNVWEWTVSLWGLDLFTPQYRYPYHAQDGREKLEASDKVYRVVRGGAFNARSSSVRCAYRYWFDPRARSDSVGFRVAIGPRLA
jgi:iron(II)-dependent oxidoreductase